MKLRGVVGVFVLHRQLTARHLFVPSFDQIIPIDSTEPDEEPKLRHIDEQLRSDASSRSRVRIQGIVTYMPRRMGSTCAATVEASSCGPPTRESSRLA